MVQTIVVCVCACVHACVCVFACVCVCACVCVDLNEVVMGIELRPSYQFIEGLLPTTFFSLFTILPCCPKVDLLKKE